MGQWGRITKQDREAFAKVRTFIKKQKVKKPVIADIFINLEG